MGHTWDWALSCMHVHTIRTFNRMHVGNSLSFPDDAEMPKWCRHPAGRNLRHLLWARQHVFPYQAIHLNDEWRGLLGPALVKSLAQVCLDLGSRIGSRKGTILAAPTVTKHNSFQEPINPFLPSSLFFPHLHGAGTIQTNCPLHD